jgi:hypothetical protein
MELLTLQGYGIYAQAFVWSFFTLLDVFGCFWVVPNCTLG